MHCRILEDIAHALARFGMNRQSVTIATDTDNRIAGDGLTAMRKGQNRPSVP